MPVIECPNCHCKYDPRNDKELAAAGDAFSLKVCCPQCEQWLRLPENEAIETPQLPPSVAKGIKRQSRLVEMPDGTPVPQKPWWKFWAS